MNRPLLEGDQNLADEDAIVRELVKCWKLDGFHKMTLSYGLDFALTRNGGDKPKIVMFVEVKKRDYTFGDGDGYWLALQKARSAWMLYELTGIVPRLAVRFNDGLIRWCRMGGFADRIIWTGRTDRGYAEDMEPHVIYGWAMFKELTDGRIPPQQARPRA